MASTVRGKYFIIIMTLSLILTSTMLACYIYQPRIFKQLDHNIYDHFIREKADNVAHPVPIIIDLDEKSLSKYGQWPWSRYLLAELITKLLDAGTLSVALDIVLSEDDRTSPYMLKKSLKQDLNLDVDFTNLPQELYDNDKLLAEKIYRKPVVLGSYLRFDSSNSNFIEDKVDPKILKKIRARTVQFEKKGAIDPKTYLLKPDGITLPINVLTEKSNIAFFNIGTELDGIVRSAPLVVSLENNIIPALSIRALMEALKVRSLRLNSNEYGLESINLGKINIPVTPDGMINIPYRGDRRTFPYISASDVLDGTIDKAQLAGKIAFIGSSSAGLLDIRATPIDTFFPGVEVHTNILDAILTQNFIITPDWTPALQFVLLIFAGIFCAYIFMRVSSGFTLLSLVLLIGATYASSWYLFTKGFFVSPLWFTLLLILLATTITAMRFWFEEKDKRKLRNIFGRYVSPEVVSRIVEQGDIQLSGEERELSIMFTDLRGFTSISEKLLPQEIVALLNSYFTPMTALVRTNEGTLDKFIGDAIMAFWNAPVLIENHSEKAVHTAINMLEKLEEINLELKEKYDINLNMGVGIHTGPAYVGNMGSEDLTSYTVIGDTVNTSSRLEGLCSKFGMRIIVSGEVVERCQLEFIPVANLRVKGRQTPIEIFTIFSEREMEKYHEELEAYKNAYKSYRTCLNNKDDVLLDKCIEMFKKLCEISNRGLYQEYYEYCQELKTMPKSDWTDVWTLTSK